MSLPMTPERAAQALEELRGCASAQSHHAACDALEWALGEVRKQTLRGDFMAAQVRAMQGQVLADVGEG